MKYILPLLLMLAVVSAKNGNPPPQETGGRWNGRYWATMDVMQQYSYLRGLLDGSDQLALALSLDDESDTCKKQHSPIALALFGTGKFSYQELIDQVSRIYEDPANRPLPIAMVAYFGAMRLEGRPQKDIDRMLDNSRRGFANASASKP